MRFTPFPSDFDSLWSPSNQEWVWEQSTYKAYVVYDEDDEPNKVARLGWREPLSESEQDVMEVLAKEWFGPDCHVYWEVVPDAKEVAVRLEMERLRLRQLDRLALRGDEGTEEYKRLKHPPTSEKPEPPKKPKPPDAVQVYRRERALAKKRGSWLPASHVPAHRITPGHIACLDRDSALGPEAMPLFVSGKVPARHLWQREEREWGSSPFFHEGRT